MKSCGSCNQNLQFDTELYEEVLWRGHNCSHATFGRMFKSHWLKFGHTLAPIFIKQVIYWVIIYTVSWVSGLVNAT